jgi:hypothetical protein
MKKALVRYISGQPNMSRVCGGSKGCPNVQAMLRERREADAVAIQARIDSTSHLLVHSVRFSSL